MLSCKNILKQFIKKNKLENKIILVGKKNREELENYYSKSKFLILPSEILEGYGNVVLEAHVFGKPVIISDFVGVKDEVLHYNSGLIFKNGNTLELTNQIKKLLCDKNLKNEFGKNGTNFISKRTMDFHFSELINIYKKTI